MGRVVVVVRVIVRVRARARVTVTVTVTVTVRASERAATKCNTKEPRTAVTTAGGRACGLP